MTESIREELIQNVKDCGDALIKNAEDIVGNYEYLKGVRITCYVDFTDEAPYINVDTDFYPEGFVKRHK